MKIEERNLLEEIAVFLKGEFISSVNVREEEIFLTFLNGQKFSVRVKEV